MTSRRQFLKLTGGALAALAVAQPALAWMPTEQTSTAADPILHLLNRITWGPRPEEAARANQIGYEAFLDEQLNPETIDDSALDAILAGMPILFMNRQETHRLVDNYGRTYKALIEGMIVRAVHSRRQLQERMVEFWTDHFNIPADELSMDLIVTHREVFRKHALGNFRDLLFGSAKSPAMLYYLDNYLSNADHPNENYARELLELHTLGVDGGYTEADVKEVARALTGWTIFDGTDSGFYFDPDMHDSEAKTILGHQLPAGRGIEDGLHVLSIAANHPSTAWFICRKLCVRFVSDNPPQSLVDSAAAVWIANAGEIRPVLRHIFTSPEFLASTGQKLRRPLDFFIGALRATGTEFSEFYVMEEMLSDLAQTPFGWQPPNGYPDVAGAWMNSSGLLARWNVAMALTHGAFSDFDIGLKPHLLERIGQPAMVGDLVDAVGQQVFAAPLPETMRAGLIAYAAGDEGESAPVTPKLISQRLGTLYGLMLASPQYQWR
jgi:hypothetical protein